MLRGRNHHAKHPSFCRRAAELSRLPTATNGLPPVWPLLHSVAFWCACLGVVGISGSVGGMVAPEQRGLALGAMSSVLLILLTAVFARVTGPRLTALGVVPTWSSGARAVAGLLAGALLVFIYFVIVAPIAGVRWARNLDVGLAAVAFALLANLAGAAAEELAFRGYPFRRLLAAHGLWPAQLIVAIAFILYHIFVAGWPVLPSIVGTGLGSLLFGMAAVATRGLAVPIGVHAAWNFGMWALGTRELPAPWEIARIDSASIALANWIAYPTAATLGILGFYALHLRRSRRGSSSSDRFTGLADSAA